MKGFTQHHLWLKNKEKLTKHTSSFRKIRSGAGFTVVEILVVMALIAILSFVFIPSYHVYKEQLAVQRSANKLSQDIRLVMERAMSALEKTECSSLISTYRHGIYLTEDNPDKYILFADCNGNNQYDAADVLIKEEVFETGVEICDLTPNFVNIVFEPPDPTIYINGSDTATIILRSKNYHDKQRTVTINKAGLIDVD